MIVLFFDMYENRIADVDTIVSCAHTEREAENAASLVGYGFPQEAAYFAFYDRANDLQLFEIKQRQEDTITRELTLYGENGLYELTTESPIRDVRPTAVTAGVAVAQALNGTRFQLGHVITTPQASSRWYYISPYAALRDIESKWPVRLKARYETSGAKITGRYVDVYSSVPVWRGKRFEVGKDVLSSVFIIDKRDVVTALIGRGKGEETGDGYGRRIDFTEIEWSKAKGDPADKPSGVDYVEDAAATALYGVCGTRPRFATVEFSEITDPQELLQSTWEALQTVSSPTLTGELNAVDLAGLGFPHEAANVGDEVAFVSDGLRTHTQIVGVVREYADTGKDEFEFGAPRDSIVSRLANVQKTLTLTGYKASAGAAVAAANESLLSGYLDTMKTQILSTGTKMYTDPNDGGFVLEEATGEKAVKLTGAGILIASGKEQGVWDWTTAIDGAGVIADTVTSGVLRAELIKILGTDRFYWDASNIYIINSEDQQQQIRIGLYDGVNYGIGYTRDGGASWQTAIGFDGVTLGVGTITADMLDDALEGRVDSFVTKNEHTLDLQEKANASDLLNKADLSEVQTLYQSFQTQTAQDITNKFFEAQTLTVEVDGRLEEFKSFVASYQRFSSAGLELGAVDSPFKALLSNVRLSFTQNGVEIAYISNNRMFISDAEITNRLTIGNFDLYKMEDGSLAFKWHQANG